MTLYEKFMEDAMGKVDVLKKRYGVNTSEAVELLKLRELDRIDSVLSEIHSIIVDGLDVSVRNTQE